MRRELHVFVFSMKILRSKIFCKSVSPKICRRCLASKLTAREAVQPKSAPKKYSNTVILPKTTFPTKTHPEFEETLQKSLPFAGLYRRQQQRAAAESFVIHDGPPYANGDLHLGHAVNKIAKDILCRYKVRRGAKVEFIPGWDCHGLPIELKALSKEAFPHSCDPLTIRGKALDLASQTIERQKESFKRWGVMADWENSYATYNTGYVTSQLSSFYKLFEKGLIYKDYLPVYWSPSNGTTLAEAEIEYQKRNGHSTYVKFKILNPPAVLSRDAGKPIYALIWTTMPWTLPANEAIALNVNKPYSLVQIDSFSELFIVGTESIKDLESALGKHVTIISPVESRILESLLYQSHFRPDEELRFIHSNDVTSEGTGLVHTAPNHGPEDYRACIKYGIVPKPCIVDKAGKFTRDAGDQLFGKYVLSEGSEAVVEILGENVIHHQSYVHSYPHDWRSKKPLLILPTSQWFIDIDSVRKQCIKSLDKVKFYCDGKEEELRLHLKSRPPWCISRQRVWGVGIPAVYHKSDLNRQNPVLSKEFLREVLSQIEKHGSGVWWSKSLQEMFTPSQWTAAGFTQPAEHFVKENDVLDVWFDSGMSWNAVLSEPKIADLYLEGVDQTRGWFQSSLILSVALQNCAPYKAVYAHGFTVDKMGRKMSKSIGNVVDPADLVCQVGFGAEALRWWVASNLSHGHIVFSTMDRYREELQKIRGTLRFCLSIANTVKQESLMDVDQLTSLDKAMLSLLHAYALDVEAMYANLDIKAVAARMYYFLTDEVSSLYISSVKDRLYCDADDSLRRKSSTTVLWLIYNIITQYLCPILPHLAQELHDHSQKSSVSVFEEPWLACDSRWFQPRLQQALAGARMILSALHKHFPGQQTSSYDAILVVSNGCLLEKLKMLQEEDFSIDSDLVSLLRLSSVEFLNEAPSIEAIQTFEVQVPGSNEPIVVFIKKTEMGLCHRCRRYTCPSSSDLCNRCLDIVVSKCSS